MTSSELEIQLRGQPPKRNTKRDYERYYQKSSQESVLGAKIFGKETSNIGISAIAILTVANVIGGSVLIFWLFFN